LCWQDAPIGRRHPSPPTPTGLMWSILGTSCGFWCLVRRRRATPTRLTPPAIRQDGRVQSSFKQKRYAFNNELIEVLKLRSLYVDQCDAMASRLVTTRSARDQRWPRPPQGEPRRASAAYQCSLQGRSIPGGPHAPTPSKPRIASTTNDSPSGPRSAAR
jgi:hypothetical protein